MDQHKPITMKDLAKHFGVSVATVSRALNNNASISEKTRDAIQQYAREHNFTPNIFGYQLRHARQSPSKLIGVIMPQIAHYYFSTILSGIEEEATSRGYQIVCAQSNEQYEREVKICEAFHKNRVCGVIVSQAKDTQQYDHFRLLQEQNIPLVFFDRISTGIMASRVVVDDYKGAYDAVSHLIESGCKRIAYYSSPMKLEISKNRYNGYKDALYKYGVPFDESLVFQADTREKAEDITPDVMAMDNRPDAFFATNDDTAIGILYTVKHMGYDVPGDVSICGFTNGERAVATDPMLTTVDQHGVKVGREAASVLIDQVEGKIPADKVERRVVRTKLMVRGTTRELRVKN